MKSAIIGIGEIGTALFVVLADNYNKINCYDLGEDQEITSFPEDETEIMHICFPYSENFIDEVKKYQERFTPKFTIIHSTVPVGTSRQCQALHSPVRGVHPRLAEGLKTFTKFLSGSSASLVADYFRRAGIKVTLFDDQETTEAMKLFDTEYYRVCIEFCHRVKKYCDKHNLNFHEVYTLANQTYNEGYVKLGHPEYVRPVLQPIMTPIGGHCVMQNKSMIQSDNEMEVTKNA